MGVLPVNIYAAQATVKPVRMVSANLAAYMQTASFAMARATAYLVPKAKTAVMESTAATRMNVRNVTGITGGTVEFAAATRTNSAATARAAI